jgi:hypothetical protein
MKSDENTSGFHLTKAQKKMNIFSIREEEKITPNVITSFGTHGKHTQSELQSNPLYS